MTAYRNLAAKCLRQKNVAVALFLVICLAFGTVFLTQSYDKTRQIQRKETYGFHNGAAFDITADSVQQLRDHKAVTQSGQMRIGSPIVDSSGLTLGYVGCVDEDFKNLEQLTFLEGTYPAADNEIAVEFLLLDQLHIPYQLGMQIDLNCMQEDGTVTVRSYQLCGIIKTYTSNWRSEGYPLCGAFVSAVDTVQKQHLFFLGEYETEEQMQELKPLVFGTKRSKLIYNSFSFPIRLEPISALFTDGSMVAAALVIGGLLMAGISISGRKRQLYKMRVFLTLGADRRELFLALLKQSALRWCMAFGAAAVLCSGICVPITYLADAGFHFALSAVPYVLSGVYSLFCCLVGTAAQILTLSKVSILPKGRDLTKYELKSSKRRRKSSICTQKAFIRVQRRRNARYYLVEVVTSMLCICVLFVCLFGTGLSIQGYTISDSAGGYDYSWTATSGAGLTPAQINKIQSTANIDSVVYTSQVQSSVDGMVYMTYPNQQTDDYLFHSNATGWDEFTDGLCVGLLVLPEASPLWDYYMPDSVSAEAFLQGECVILFLPELGMSEEGFYRPINTFGVNSMEAVTQSWLPDISVGDPLTLYVHTNSKTVECAYMMQRFPGYSQTVMDFLVPGTVLVSEKLFCELMGMKAIRYNDVFAIGNDRLTYEVGDKLMSGISPYVNFTNNRVERETERKILLTDITSFGSIAIFVCALGIALLIRNRRSLMEAESSRLRLLKDLGCSSKTVERSYFAGMGYWFIPLAALLNICVLLTYAYWRRAFDVPKAAFFPFLKALFNLSYLKFPWILLVIPQLLLLYVLVLIFKKSTINERK